MKYYKRFCKLRDQRKPGAEAPQYTEAEAFALSLSTACAAHVDTTLLRRPTSSLPQPKAPCMLVGCDCDGGI